MQYVQLWVSWLNTGQEFHMGWFRCPKNRGKVQSRRLKRWYASFQLLFFIWPHQYVLITVWCRWEWAQNVYSDKLHLAIPCKSLYEVLTFICWHILGASVAIPESFTRHSSHAVNNAPFEHCCTYISCLSPGCADNREKGEWYKNGLVRTWNDFLYHSWMPGFHTRNVLLS